MILAVMTVLVFLTVIYRYILLAPISWGEEMSRFLFIALCIFGAAIAMKERAHFVITLLTDKFPVLLRTWLEVGVALATSLLLSVVIFKGWGLVLLNRNQDSPALGVNMSLPYAAIPLGATLMLIFLWTDLIIKRCDGDATQRGTKEETPGSGLEKGAL
jgi:TRAP-type C4-dicarboxylate transport system permease small subunit